jgi:hypothetical protein
MMSYASAAIVANKLAQGKVFAIVTSGKYKGTVGKITSIKSHHYSKHSYILEFPGRSIKFCGSILRECEEQELVIIYNEDFVPTYLDFNEREIKIGDRIVVSKRSEHGHADMLLGNVRRIDVKGVYFAPFAINGNFTNDTVALVKITRNNSVMVLDSSTTGAILMQKLSAGSID